MATNAKVTEPSDLNAARLGLRVLRRRWRIVLLTTLAAVALSLAYSLTSTPLYLAEADVLLDSPNSGDSRIPSEEMATQTHVVTSLPVARLVQDHLDLVEEPDLDEVVSVQSVGTSRILRITSTDSDPERAATTANAVAAAYLQFRESESIGRYEAAQDRLVQEQASQEEQLATLDERLAQQPESPRALESERRTVLNTLTQISTQLDALHNSLSTATSGGEVLRNAAVPSSPVSPTTVLNGVIGGLFGLLLGIGTALVRDRFDDVVHEAGTVSHALDSVVLARVPRSGDAQRDRLVTLSDPHSAASEEYQRLAVNVRFMLATATGGRSSATGAIALVTSAQAGEGKTVTAANLAVAASRLGLRVTLVDADFRRSSLAARFDQGASPGLSDLLVSTQAVTDVLRPVGPDDLRLLTTGVPPPNPAALLGSARMRQVLADLQEACDLVVVDSTPLLTVADSLELAALADIVLTVTREGLSRRRQLSAVNESLRHLAVRCTGVVVNSVTQVPQQSSTYSPSISDDDRPSSPGPSPAVPPDPTVTEASRP